MFNQLACISKILCSGQKNYTTTSWSSWAKYQLWLYLARGTIAFAHLPKLAELPNTVNLARKANKIGARIAARLKKQRGRPIAASGGRQRKCQ